MSNISQNTDPNSPTATVTWTPPKTSDNAKEGVTKTSSHNPGDSFPIGTTTVIYTATDPYGNSATMSFDVVITGKMEGTSDTNSNFIIVFLTFVIISKPNIGSVICMKTTVYIVQNWEIQLS